MNKFEVEYEFIDENGESLPVETMVIKAKDIRQVRLILRDELPEAHLINIKEVK
jgi:hypothetical protein